VNTCLTGHTYYHLAWIGSGFEDKQVMAQAQPVAFPVTGSRRKYERSAVSLHGRLFVPAENSEQSCQVVDLSAGSARVACEDVPPPSTYVILYVDGFGRFPAVTTCYHDGAIAMRFDLSEKRREKLTAQIRIYLKAGIAGVTSLRRHRRMPAPAEGTFRRESGEEIACNIRDLSLRGAFLETECRPQLGEVIAIGPHRGGVICHEAQGFAIKFITGGN
jgi:PilZ domain